MQITFYDKNMFETAVADNALMNAIKIKKASLTSLFEEATHQVEFEFSKEFGEWWGIRENGYLAFRFKGDFFRFSIVKFKEDAKTNTITIIGDYFNLEMLNENCIAYEKQPARTIVQHFNAMEILPYANFEIGVNELANSTRVLTYTGDEVKYKRLISIVNNFGGECEFEIKQKANGQFDKLVLNIYKANDGVNYQGVGRNRRDFEINIDNSNNVSRMVDSTEIKTSIEPIGKDGLRLGNRGTTWKNEDGQVEFYQKNNRIYAPLAADEMQRVLDSDKFLLWKQSIDTDNVAKLESEGLKWLKNVCYAKENIEVSGSFDVRVGDTVILNHKGIGKYGILGSLRVTKIVWDLLTETNEVTFSNFKRLASKISAQGLALQESIESPASYDITFNTTGGTVFKNNTGSSNVSFNFSKNGTQTAVLGQRWYNGTQLLSNGLEVMIKPDMLTDGKLNLRLEVDVTDTITFSKELTFINVNDGVNGSNGRGITSTEDYYLVSSSKTGITSATTGWVKGTPQVATATNKYHWHYHVDIYTDGTRKETVPAVIGIYGDQGLKGDTGVGILSTSVTYGVSSSNTTQPTTWSSTQPTVPPGQYLWKRTITDYTDPNTPDTIEITYTYQGKDGVQGQPGIAGTSVSVSKIEYQAGTSATIAPTGTWSSSMVSAPAGQFLWSKTTMSDNSIIYGISRQGADGQNGQIPHIAYANKSTDIFVDSITAFATPSAYNGSVLTSTKIPGGYKMTSTGGTSQVKQIIPFNGTTGKSCYTYLKIKNTHATNDILLTFNGIGATLNTNFTSIVIKAGQTYVDFRQAICRDTYNFIQINVGAYVAANDISYEVYDFALFNTIPFINLSLEANTNCDYMGMYQDTNATGSTDPSKYAWTLIKGQKGDQGLPGTPGADGKTPYWHTAWANNSTGTLDFSLTDSSGRKYRGEYIDYTQADSTDPTKYKWVDLTANVKVGGVNLLRNTSTDWKDISVSQYAGAIIVLTNTDLPNLKVGDFITFSLDISTLSSKSLRARISFGGANKHYFSEKVINNSDGRSTVSATVPDGWTNITLYIDATLTATTITSITTEKYRRAKLEIGNIATDYSKAPEDIQASIDSKAEQEYTDAQMLALEERTALARENAIAEAMQNTISEVEAKWQLWYETNTTDEKQKVANDIATLFDRTAEFNQLLGEATAKFSFINNETLIGEEGIAIGDKDGKAKLFLSNDSISFVTNGVAQMTLTGDTLTIKNGLFTERMQIGNFVEEVYDRNPLFNVIRAIRNS
ncbi:phage tail protein [Streptococcus agalactiae]|uniref:phage tail protein n=1 Tax=Streptococcus agalactiae TaxID=1311 RepID=UPI00215B506E|nr:phage tail protein [Streptococcus agalactiae]